MTPEHDELYKAYNRIKELEEENRELKNIVNEGTLNVRPFVIDNPNWTSVKELADRHITELEIGDGYEEDIPHYIFEEVMKALYGDKIFDYLNPLYG